MKASEIAAASERLNAALWTVRLSHKAELQTQIESTEACQRLVDAGFELSVIVWEDKDDDDHKVEELFVSLRRGWTSTGNHDEGWYVSLSEGPARSSWQIVASLDEAADLLLGGAS